MDLDKQWKQLFVNILLENIKNSSNKLFSFHMTSPADDREEPHAEAGCGVGEAVSAAGSGWHRAPQPFSGTLVSTLLGSAPEPCWAGRVDGSRAKLETDPSSAAREVFQCPGWTCQLTAQLSNVSQSDSLLLHGYLLFFFCFRWESMTSCSMSMGQMMFWS